MSFLTLQRRPTTMSRVQRQLMSFMTPSAPTNNHVEGSAPAHELSDAFSADQQPYREFSAAP
eukprot:170242-Chlamydomonas_euryale.AAC.8